MDSSIPLSQLPIDEQVDALREVLGRDTVLTGVLARSGDGPARLVPDVRRGVPDVWNIATDGIRTDCPTWSTSSRARTRFKRTGPA